LVEKGTLIALPDFSVRFNSSQQAKVGQLLGTFNQEPYSPPSVKECQALLGEEVYQSLVEGGQLVQVSVDVVFLKKTYDELVNSVRQHFTLENTLTVAQFRDRFNTSRRYVLAFLEHLDAIGETVREGEGRRKK
jgi:selenocysteine-specific elongation factor